MPEKQYLVTPGPTPVPPEVLAATAAPMVHHRGPDFRSALVRILERLGEVYRTENDVLLFASAGTGALEGVVANLCSPGDRVLAVSHGYFGERWASIAKAYGCEVVHLGHNRSVQEVVDAARWTRRAGQRSSSSRIPRPLPVSFPTCARSRSASRTPEL